MALSGSSQMLVHGNGVPWISRSWLWQFIHGDASTRVRRPPLVDRGLVSRAFARLCLALMGLRVLVSLI